MSVPASTERVLSTLNTDGSRRWLDPRTSRGGYWRRRRALAYALIALFVALPFVRVGGRPALLLDLSKPEFVVAGATFFSNDLVLLMLFLLTTFVGVFLLTAVLGRAWCGWACPQTVYLEWVFRPLERWLEPKGRGGRARGPLTYAVFAALSVFLAHVFLGYFVPVEVLAGWVTGSPAQHWPSFLLVVAVSALIFFDFASFREQMCVVACPYARLQSGLLDRDSLIVGYDAARGEPRGKLRGANPALPVLGDCIDCRACVATCPTGIDIRDGLQLECIACAQCADACDGIMDRVGRARGLVGYTSQARLARSTEARRPRVRLIVYPLILAALVGVLVFQVTRRGGAEVSVVRAVGEPFRALPDGRIANAFRVRVRNRDGAPRRYALALERAPDAELIGAATTLEVGAHALETADVFVVVPRASLATGGREIVLTVREAGASTGAAAVDSRLRLLGPRIGAGEEEVE